LNADKPRLPLRSTIPRGAVFSLRPSPGNRGDRQMVWAAQGMREVAVYDDVVLFVAARPAKEMRVDAAGVLLRVEYRH